MSHQDYIQEFLQSSAEIKVTCENNSLMACEIMLSVPSDSKETTAADVMNSCTNLPLSESGDDTVSTSVAVDPNKQDILINWTRPRLEVEGTDDIFSLDLPKSTCGRSDSEGSERLTGDSGDWFSFLESDYSSEWGGTYWEYKRLVTNIREDGWLLPFEVICLAFTIACCFMGAYNWSMCPADIYIPRYVFINGAIATFAVCAEIMDSLWKLIIKRFDGSLKYKCAFGIGWIAIITTLIEMIEFYTMPYSFQKNEENYCNETFYWFVYYKNIACGVLMSLTALIYIPSFSRFYYCQDNLDVYL